MRIVPKTMEEFRKEVRPMTDNYKLLTDFANSDYECVKLEGYTHKDAKSCQSSICASIRKFRMIGIRVRIHRDDVFLVKEEQVRNKKK